MSKVKSVFLAFEAHLDELLLLVDNNEFVPKLKSSLNAIVNWNDISQEQKDLVNNFYKLKATPSRSLYNSIYISAVASFESYLTQTIEGIVEAINSKFPTFEKLPRTLVNKHMELTGKILSSIHTPPDHLSIDFFKVGMRIGSIHPTSEKTELNTEIAGYVKKILELEGFINFLNSCEYKIDFDTISNDTTVKSAFETTKARETVRQIQAFLVEIKKMRNRIAHTGQSSSDITSDSLRIMIMRLKALSKRISDIILDQL